MIKEPYKPLRTMRKLSSYLCLKISFVENQQKKKSNFEWKVGIFRSSLIRKNYKGHRSESDMPGNYTYSSFTDTEYREYIPSHPQFFTDTEYIESIFRPTPSYFFTIVWNLKIEINLSLGNLINFFKYLLQTYVIHSFFLFLKSIVYKAC